MKVLVVEDDGVKQQKIVEFLKRDSKSISLTVDVCDNAVEAVGKIKEIKYNLLILDVLLPAIPKGEPLCENCEFILNSIDSDPSVIPPTYCVGLTQDKDIKDSFQTNFLRSGWSLHYYSDNDQWQGVIKNIYFRAANQPLNVSSYDYGVVCALKDPELDAFFDISDFDFKITHVNRRESLTFYEAEFTDLKGSTRSIVCCHCSQMGLVSAAVTTTKMIYNFDPHVIAMCGITAGIEGTTDLGDLIVASSSWDYSSGKLAIEDDETVFLPDSYDIPMAPWVLGRLNLFSDEWSSSKDFTVRTGPLASGVNVVADDQTTGRLKRHKRKILGIEMETYGVYYAATNTVMQNMSNRIFFSCKGVSDFANPNKDDSVRDQASLRSAEYVRDLILTGTLLE